MYDEGPHRFATQGPSRMKLPVLLTLLASLALSGCLSKVPPEKRAGDPWRERSEQLSRPMVVN
ncbi:hypothetical protein GCM10011390_42730 [Aureimonas endophytica]|uniref:Lipoprotein n=1 Tax=Aureimonas endophytica TaxID=2027858 RepID=A0A916ZZK9_9HYPH|nr:hypothetical protein GCM10011390_42730 [Aureimonas endophytica]